MKSSRVLFPLVVAVLLFAAPYDVRAAPSRQSPTPSQADSAAAAVAEADRLCSTEPGKTYFRGLFPVVHRVLMDAFHDYAGSRHVPPYWVDVVFVLGSV